LLTFLTLYVFIYTFLIPSISVAIKARTIQQDIKSEAIIKENDEQLGTNLSNIAIKQNIAEVSEDINNL